MMFTSLLEYLKSFFEHTHRQKYTLTHIFARYFAQTVAFSEHILNFSHLIYFRNNSNHTLRTPSFTYIQLNTILCYFIENVFQIHLANILWLVSHQFVSKFSISHNVTKTTTASIVFVTLAEFYKSISKMKMPQIRI